LVLRLLFSNAKFGIFFEMNKCVFFVGNDTTTRNLLILGVLYLSDYFRHFLSSCKIPYTWFAI